MSSFDVIVVGAGTNGLTAAGLLARAGRRVVVLERRAVAGGLAVGDELHAGRRSVGLLHDTSGLRPEVVADLDLERHGLRLTAGPPAVLAPETDGRGLLLEHAPDAAAAEIEAFSAHDAGRYRAYRAFIDRVRPVLGRVLGEAPPAVARPGLATLGTLAARGLALRRLGRGDMTDLLRVVPMCVVDWLDEWFETDLLKSLLAAPALEGLFAGPRSPATAGALLRSEVTAGRAVEGGPAALVDALVAAAEAQGVELRTACTVRRITVEGKRVHGVELDDGVRLEAPVVAASCDPKCTFLRLLASRDVPSALERRIERYRARGVTAKVDLVLREPLRFACRPGLAVERARIGGSLDDLERGFDAVKYGRCSSRLRLDVYAPVSGGADGSSSAAAQLVSIVAHAAPYELSGGWTDEARASLGDAVVSELTRYAPDLPSTILTRAVLTPVDIESRYGTTQGHVHHGEHALDQLLVRPAPECARYATPIPGLYLCGSGSHPGGGLTGAPGRLAARAILGR